ncbi:MAG: hypothetical protein J1F66_02980 [Clostridiales bacterium]|nr:hypothetical protein [Clostridiales bacterium]
MRCCNNNGRFLNEQTYLNTVCKSRQPPCCKKPKPRCDKDRCYTEYICCTPRGKLTLRADSHSMGISVEVKRCDCDDDRH